ALVEDLAQNRGKSVVVVGKHQPPAVHALGQRINEALGNFGRTVRHIAPVEANQRPNVGSLSQLVDDLNGGGVSLLLMIDTNPVYTAPADLAFAEALQKARIKIHAGQIQDETSALCEWHLPLSHNLEAWGDARAFDGTATIIQPLIAPLFGSRSAIEILAKMTDRPLAGYDLVRETWRRSGLGGADFERFWNASVHDGVVANSASKPVTLSASGGGMPLIPTGGGTEVAFRVDPCVYDGRYANNGWLQELPKPVSKLTWDNAAFISPRTAQTLGVRDEEKVRITVEGRSVEAGVLIQPGHADETVTVHLGYGRTKGGTVATASLSEDGEGKSDNGGGFNAYLLRSTTGLDYAPGTLEKIPGLYPLATTQSHGPLNDDKVKTEANPDTPVGDPKRDYNLDQRDVVRDYTLAYYLQHVDEIIEHTEEKREEFNKNNLYPDQIFETKDIAQWGMTIDMNTCIGCNACVTACQSENNIPVVGKIQTKRHRNMHWIRIDRYYSGSDLDNPDVTYQPLMCVHCEKAPCEPVCPVAATVHSHDGLNMMVYNRCVGTRYCSNNCPYKVRRFNYLNYSDNQPNFANVTFQRKEVPGPIHSQKGLGREMLRMSSNPNVTVRGRGVMEKCTYCVQRINNARIEAKKAGREIRDGDVVTACQQACPTNTIVFGNIADKNSEVSRLREDPRAYLLLEELLTRPRTSHLAKLRNPNENIRSAVSA
ncbi:MAG TPA: 4Fe-4S dicluster domain-containing protein, partial [Fimbriimonas sp.]